MAERDRVAEIIEIKTRGQREATRIQAALEKLQERWKQFSKGRHRGGLLPDPRGNASRGIFARLGYATG